MPKTSFPFSITSNSVLLAIALILFVGILGADDYSVQIDSLRQEIIGRGVPEAWFDDLVSHENFQIYPSMNDYFERMAEHRVDHKQEKDFDWYLNFFGVPRKIELGRAFIEENREILEKVEARNGIHYEIVVAIIGMETNFAQKRHRGSFHTFNTLVSQYVLMPRRRRFAMREIESLYKFSERTERDVWEFIGSFAGAAGWGQFIPSSMQSFFIDANDDETDIDIFSVDDNLFSIENYLHKHGLKRENMGKRQSRYDAVYAYNHSEAYVRAVLYIYEHLHADRTGE